MIGIYLIQFHNNDMVDTSYMWLGTDLQHRQVWTVLYH